MAVLFWLNVLNLFGYHINLGFYLFHCDYIWISALVISLHCHYLTYIDIIYLSQLWYVILFFCESKKRLFQRWIKNTRSLRKEFIKCSLTAIVLDEDIFFIDYPYFEELK